MAARGMVFAALTLSLLAPACGTLVRPSDAEQERSIEARRVLDAYVVEFEHTVRDAAEKIVDESTDMEVRRNSVHWKLDAISRTRALGRSEDPNHALLGLWLFTGLMEYFFEKGGGREAFGEVQPIAVEASKTLYTSIEGIAKDTFHNEKSFELAKTDVLTFVEKYGDQQAAGSIQGPQALEAAIRDFSKNAKVASWMPSLSLQAFNPLSGLNESAAAIRYMTDKTDQVIEDVTMELPWRIELLAYDIEQRQTVVSAKTSLAEVSASATSLAKTAQSLPADVQSIVTTSLDELDAKQENLRLTLKQAEDTLTRAEGVVSGLEQTAAHMTEAGDAWTRTFHSLGLKGDEKPEAAPPPTTEPEEKSRPFDILDYRDTAVELQKVAVELRGLVGDVRDLAADSGPDTPLSNVETVARTSVGDAMEQAHGLVDHIAVRALELLGAALVAAILYRWIALHLRRGVT